MKLTKKLLIVGTIATFATVPAVYAEDAAVEPSPGIEEPIAEEPIEDIVIDEPVVDEPVEDVIIDDGEVGVEIEDVVIEDGDVNVEIEIIDCDPGFEGGGEMEHIEGAEAFEGIDPAVCEMTGNPEVQRDGDTKVDSDLIFQNTAFEGRSETASADRADSLIGRDERGADIQSKASGLSEVKKDKKGPVALIKKGRVFLR